MVNDMKVSVIVPVYNLEEYLKKSLDSLANQTLKDLEVILVDDGSKDSSPKILNEYAKKYKNFKVIHKKNGGVSAARNDGLDVATGEYIAFLDGDDWLETDCFEKAYKKAKEGKCDIVAYDTLAIYPDKNMHISSNIEDEQDNRKLMIDAYAVVCNKLFKRTILKGIKFREKIALAEDVLFLYQTYPRIKRIGTVKEPFLNYLQRQGSATYVYDEKIYDLIKVMDIICDEYKDKKIFEEYKEEIEYTYVRYLYATFIKRLAKTKNKDEFNKGVEYVIEKVNSTFPDYKKNKYIKALNGKSLYLRYFNKLISKLIFMLEKNKMN